MANHKGTVAQIIGPVLDIRFADGDLPQLLSAIEIPHNGGTIVAEGTPEQIAACEASFTGQYLKKMLEGKHE